MNYADQDITKRAQESKLWPDLDKQQSKALPYILERYLLLENWKYIQRTDPEIEGRERHPLDYDLNYLHILLAEVVTVLLDQQERIRMLEAKVEALGRANL